MEKDLYEVGMSHPRLIAENLVVETCAYGGGLVVNCSGPGACASSGNLRLCLSGSS